MTWTNSECTLRHVVGQVSRSLREANRAALVDALRVSGPTSRAALARRTGLAKQTVSTIVAQLLTDGVVREVGRDEPERASGRRGSVVQCAADGAFVVGVGRRLRRSRVTRADRLGARGAGWELAGTT